MLTVALTGVPATDVTVLRELAPRAAHEPPLDRGKLIALGLRPHALMRPGRVYALDEMLDYDDRLQLSRQREALRQMRIRHARFLRVVAPGAAEASLVMVREREDFSATAVSQIASIAEYLAAALRSLAALCAERLQSAMAQSSLARLGVGQIAFDAGGHVLAADPQAEARVAILVEPGEAGPRRLQLLPETARALESACAALAVAPRGSTRAIRIPGQFPLDLLLRTADLALPPPGIAPAAIGSFREARAGNPPQDARALAAIHGLSDREAALAIALSRGQTIVDAGRDLRLTAETARNYSKRIYAKTGTAGQADLVRLILSGLAPLA
jgi:DNA-binding CsgD family transcriptional regulator